MDYFNYRFPTYSYILLIIVSCCIIGIAFYEPRSNICKCNKSQLDICIIETKNIYNKGGTMDIRNEERNNSVRKLLEAIEKIESICDHGCKDKYDKCRGCVFEDIICDIYKQIENICKSKT